MTIGFDGLIVAYDPTIAQIAEKHKKRVVRIWKARSSEDLETQLIKNMVEIGRLLLEAAPPPPPCLGIISLKGGLPSVKSFGS